MLAQGISLLQPVSQMKQITGLLTMIALAACVPQHSSVNRQMIGLLEKFDRWDYNGNGQLDRSELKEAETLSGIEASDIVAFYDTGKNGTISLAEAEAGLSRLEEARLTVSEIENRQ
jgi:Ca2+-binding EF-hand superfamily protein